MARVNVNVTAAAAEGREEAATTMGSDASGEVVGRRQGLISLAAATMTFAGMSMGEADALESSDCLECGGSGVVVCTSPLPSLPTYSTTPPPPPPPHPPKKRIFINFSHSSESNLPKSSSLHSAGCGRDEATVFFLFRTSRAAACAVI